MKLLSEMVQEAWEFFKANPQAWVRGHMFVDKNGEILVSHTVIDGKATPCKFCVWGWIVYHYPEALFKLPDWAPARIVSVNDGAQNVTNLYDRFEAEKLLSGEVFAGYHRPYQTSFAVWLHDGDDIGEAGWYWWLKTRYGPPTSREHGPFTNAEEAYRDAIANLSSEERREGAL